MVTAEEQPRILVTGGRGFLGSHLLDALEARGYENVSAPSSSEYDLREGDAIREALADTKPDVVIHLAARVGGIGANRVNPATYLYDNLMMGTQLIHESWKAGVSKMVILGTVCAYPKFTPVPFREDDLWTGYPEETNAPYGIAKKLLLVQAQAYRAQYGFNSIFLLPSNLYGPRDNFNPDSSHVVPALIRRCVEAKNQGMPTLDVWGDGSASREFLHARDAARGILMATEMYDEPEAVNLGTGQEVTIRELVEMIQRATGFHGEIQWLTDMPNGQPRRALDTSRAKDKFGFQAEVPFEEGLNETVRWWLTEGEGAT